MKDKTPFSNHILDELQNIIDSLKHTCYLIVSDFIPKDISREDEEPMEGGFLVSKEATGLKHPLVIIHPDYYDKLIEQTQHMIIWIDPSLEDWEQAFTRDINTSIGFVNQTENLFSEKPLN